MKCLYCDETVEANTIEKHLQDHEACILILHRSYPSRRRTDEHHETWLMIDGGVYRYVDHLVSWDSLAGVLQNDLTDAASLRAHVQPTINNGANVIATFWWGTNHFDVYALPADLVASPVFAVALEAATWDLIEAESPSEYRFPDGSAIRAGEFRDDWCATDGWFDWDAAEGPRLSGRCERLQRDSMLWVYVRSATTGALYELVIDPSDPHRVEDVSPATDLTD